MVSGTILNYTTGGTPVSTVKSPIIEQKLPRAHMSQCNPLDLLQGS